ncbi:MAG: transcriptional regulator, AraC family [Paenibacillus sp.]|jgi:AraC-like DNA-binding protein|nr:transcriptional regulator, AraC family [Paenibacillus sp.]
MAERKPPPIYEDFVGSASQHHLTTTERFYIDVRYSRYSYLHHHNYAELSFYYQGTGYETINGVRHRLQPGTVSLVRPHQIHIIKCDPEPKLLKYCCMFDIQLLPELAEDRWFSSMVYGVGIDAPSHVYFDGEESNRVERIFGHLLEEHQHSDNPGRLQMIRTLLNEALLLFIRRGLADRQKADPAMLAPEDKSRVLWPLLQYVHAHYHEKMSLKEMADRFFMSVPYMSRLFKTHVGMGFVEYVHRLRVERASGMLLNTDMSVNEIAFDVGFDNSRTFSRVFRELKGKTATEFRIRAET